MLAGAESDGAAHQGTVTDDRNAYYGLRDNYVHLASVMELLVRCEDTSFDLDLSTSQCVYSTHL